MKPTEPHSLNAKESSRYETNGKLIYIYKLTTLIHWRK